MTPFFGKFPIVPCVSCGAPLRWHVALHRKLRVGGMIFRLGVCGIAIALPFVFLLSKNHLAIVVTGASIILSFVGILVTAIRTVTPFVEVIEGDAGKR